MLRGGTLRTGEVGRDSSRTCGRRSAMRGDRTRRVLAMLGSMVFFFAAPGTVVALVPWWMSRWRIQATFPASSVLRFVGAILVITGYSRPNGFVRAVRPSGFGHAGPRFPATSPCGHRLIPLCSQPHVPRRRIGHRRAGLVLRQPRAPRVRSYEEPKLRATFEDEYEAFCANVPRWRPRVRPWPRQA